MRHVTGQARPGRRGAAFLLTLVGAAVVLVAAPPRAAGWGEPASPQPTDPKRSGWGAPAEPKAPAVRQPSLPVPSAPAAQGAAKAARPAVTANPTPAASQPSDAAQIQVKAPRFATAPPPLVTKIDAGIAIENLTLTLGPVRYVVPRAEIRGTPLSVADVQALLDPASNVPVAERVARISATEIVAGHLISEQEIGGVKQVTTYRDVVAAGVNEGRIASLRSGRGTFGTDGDARTGEPKIAGPGTVKGEVNPAQGTFDRLSIEDANLPLAFTLYAGTGAAEPGAMRRLYGSISLENLALTDPKGATTRIARLASGEVLARPSRDGLAAGAALFGTGPIDLNRAAPAERRRVLAIATDLLDSFDIRSLEATGFAFADPQNPANAGQIARIGFRSGGPDRPTEIALDGLDATSESGRVRIGAIAVGGLSLRPFLDSAGDLAAAPTGAASGAYFRSLVPGSGTLRIADLSFEPPAGKADTTSPVGFTIGGIEVAADKPVESMPSDLRVALREITFPVSPGGGTKDLAELGYTRLSASFGLAAGWNEAGREIVLRDLSVRSPELGSLAVSGRFGNVTRDVFDRDSAVALVALLGATATSAEVTVDNAGLFERIVARQAAKEGRSPEDLRREWGVAASIGVPMLLGSSPSSKALGAALARFVAKPRSLAIQARSTNPAGLSLTDLTGNPDPTALLARLDITATAN